MTAIERDYYEPDLRGKAFINLKHIPNGQYTIYYLRIGQPISINSRIKVLGQSNNLFVNIKREAISDDKRPQLDLGNGSGRIGKQETSMFKILKAKNSRDRDNKILNLNLEEEREQKENELDKALSRIIEEKEKSMVSNGGMEMEFDGNGTTAGNTTLSAPL